jgi:hypothetical protein
MRIIELDATKWNTVLDFYHALLAAIGAPKWHGISPDALVDSMIWGGINAVDPPYTIRISGVSSLSKEVREEIELAKEDLANGRDYRKRHKDEDVEVSIVTDDPEAKPPRKPVEYEGPDPQIGKTMEMLRRQLKLGPQVRLYSHPGRR